VNASYESCFDLRGRITLGRLARQFVASRNGLCHYAKDVGAMFFKNRDTPPDGAVGIARHSGIQISKHASDAL
jgi:hypothetical protein